MSLPRPCGIVRLPFDIWEAGLLPRFTRASLAATSLTCRSLRTLLSPLLFAELALRVPDFDLHWTNERHRRRKDILANFIRRLNSTSASAVLVHTRTLHLVRDITTSRNSGREWQDRASELASIVFPRLPRLLNVTFYGMCITAAHLHAISGLDMLQSLSISDCSFDFHPHVLGSLHLRLQTLTIHAGPHSPCVEWLLSSLVHSRIQNLFLRLGSNPQAHDVLGRLAPLNDVKMAQLTIYELRDPFSTLSRFFPNAESLFIDTPLVIDPSMMEPLEAFPLVPASLARFRSLTLPACYLRNFLREDMRLDHLTITSTEDADLDFLHDPGRGQAFALRHLTSLSIRLYYVNGEKLHEIVDAVYYKFPLLCRLQLGGTVMNALPFLENLKLSPSMCYCSFDLTFNLWGARYPSLSWDIFRRMTGCPALEYMAIFFRIQGLRITFDRDVFGPLSADTYLQQCTVIEDEA